MRDGVRGRTDLIALGATVHKMRLAYVSSIRESTKPGGALDVADRPSPSHLGIYTISGSLMRERARALLAVRAATSSSRYARKSG